jgi:hypothetical protein
VSATDYIINAILVLLVLRQIRENRLDLVSLVLPVVLVAGAAAYYLRSIPTQGNDLALDLTLGAIGAALGIGCALATRMRRGGDGVALARAGWLAAVLWIVGIGCRMGFAFASDHGAGPSIARFSVAHSITSSQAWVAALVLMALAEVIARLVTMRVRARRLPAQAEIARTPARAAQG